MRSIEEQMKEILRRRDFYLAQRQARNLTALSAGLAGLLLFMLFIAPGVTGSLEQQSATVLGATILGPEAGGYVIVALLAFTLGIIVTLLIQNRKKQTDCVRKTQNTEKGIQP